MRKNRVIKAFLVLSFLIVLVGTLASFANAQDVSSLSTSSSKSVCPEPTADSAKCNSKVVLDSKGQPLATAIRTLGFGPAQFRGAYGVSGISTVNRTIAIVSAFDHPRILLDLNTYSRVFKIPEMKSCAVSSGTLSKPCFQKVDQRGGTSYPKTDGGWALETAIDVETVHAMCQNCNILLVEADTNLLIDLLKAVDRATVMGAPIVSNSWGAHEVAAESLFDHHFNYPGMAFVFGTGDDGYGTFYPAASPYVTAVGGTSLYVNKDNSYQSETVWEGAGSGCSLYEAKPSFQHDTSCTNRTIADVSADADPKTGAAVFDSVLFERRAGWFIMGGTSLSTPLVAGMYGLAGIPSDVLGNTLPYSLGNSGNLHDITSGSNGSCGGTYLCTGVVGYDGPTGLGSPNGTGAF